MSTTNHSRTLRFLQVPKPIGNRVPPMKPRRSFRGRGSFLPRPDLKERKRKFSPVLPVLGGLPSSLLTHDQLWLGGGPRSGSGASSSTQLTRNDIGRRQRRRLSLRYPSSSSRVGGGTVDLSPGSSSWKRSLEIRSGRVSPEGPGRRHRRCGPLTVFTFKGPGRVWVTKSSRPLPRVLIRKIVQGFTTSSYSG